MCLQTFHGVEKTPLFYYNNQHQEKRFGGSKKGIRFSKKFFETHRKPHGYWVPVISVTKDRKRHLRLQVPFSVKFVPLERVKYLRCEICLRHIKERILFHLMRSINFHNSELARNYFASSKARHFTF